MKTKTSLDFRELCPIYPVSQTNTFAKTSQMFQVITLNVSGFKQNINFVDNKH